MVQHWHKRKIYAHEDISSVEYVVLAFHITDTHRGRMGHKLLGDASWYGARARSFETQGHSDMAGSMDTIYNNYKGMRTRCDARHHICQCAWSEEWTLQTTLCETGRCNAINPMEPAFEANASKELSTTVYSLWDSVPGRSGTHKYRFMGRTNLPHCKQATGYCTHGNTSTSQMSWPNSECF